MTREENILSYLNGYSGGYYNSESTDRAELIRKTVENVLAWHDIAETRANVRKYSETMEKLAEGDEGLIIRKNIYTHTWMVETRD
jgi:hypothetical protein